MCKPQLRWLCKSLQKTTQISFTATRQSLDSQWRQRHRMDTARISLFPWTLHLANRLREPRLRDFLQGWLKSTHSICCHWIWAGMDSSKLNNLWPLICLKEKMCLTTPREWGRRTQTNQLWFWFAMEDWLSTRATIFTIRVSKLWSEKPLSSD